MKDWTSGYVADIEYTFGYYTELNPLRVKLAFLNAGLVSPDILTACELGFGQGLSSNIHAAATDVSWYGTDFNPAQTSFAQEMASVYGTDTKLYDDDFEDFARRSDLPDFDYIGIHGIWSWINDSNRLVLIDFIRRKLKTGGVLYISYNTLPGWSAFAPLRHLMTLHSEVMGIEGHGIVHRINDALEFTDQLLQTQPLYSTINPNVINRFQQIKGQNRKYLAHEYFNLDWHPMYFGAMAKCLSTAKLSYACSANYLDYIDGINLKAEQQNFLQGIVEPLFRESIRDYMVNQQFRRDYWVKGARTLTMLERAERLRMLRVILLTPRSDVSLKINGALGEASMSEEVYQPLLDCLADHKIKSLAHLERSLSKYELVFQQLLEAVLLLVGAGHLAVAQDDLIIHKVKKHSDKLNAYLLNKARSTNDINYLSSPVTGGGIGVSRFEQLFLLALHQGRKTTKEWVQFTWDILTSQGQVLVKDGNKLNTAEENITELTLQANTFSEKKLSILKALQIA